MSCADARGPVGLPALAGVPELILKGLRRSGSSADARVPRPCRRPSPRRATPPRHSWTSGEAVVCAQCRSSPDCRQHMPSPTGASWR
eukprot:scaffold442_cov397-Prasinococcus_capsulatus_cf.AAC.26